MQLKYINSSRYIVRAPGGQADHIKGLEQVLVNLSTTEDLILHFQNKSTLRTNKMPLLFTSKLFTKLLVETCPCPNALYQEYNVICPDFDPDSMSRVLELITTGATVLDAVDQDVYNGMLFIIDSLQINIKLKEIWSNVPANKLKITKPWRISKRPSSVSRSTTDEWDSSYFPNNIKQERKKSYR